MERLVTALALVLGRGPGARGHGQIVEVQPWFARARSRREQEIAALAVSGLSAREISERLFLSVRTVENHLQRVYTKLGLSNRNDLASYYSRP